MAIAGFNAAFGLVLGFALALQSSFAREIAVHRESGVPSESNLARALEGDWLVAERFEPPGVPRFPGRGLRLTFFGTTRGAELIGGRPELRDAWAALDPAATFRPRTRLFERLEAMISLRKRPSFRFFVGYPVAFPGARWERPALVVEMLRKPQMHEMPSTGHSVWVAELRDLSSQRLELRLVYAEGVVVPASAHVRLERAEARGAGRDLAAELADLDSTEGWP
jgi:hypothetical protein